MSRRNLDVLVAVTALSTLALLGCEERAGMYGDATESSVAAETARAEDDPEPGYEVPTVDSDDKVRDDDPNPLSDL